MTNMASTYGARASILISPPSQLAEPVYVAMVTIELGHRACMALDSSAVNVVRPSCMPGYAGSVFSWYKSRCEQMLFVHPHATPFVRPNITAGIPAYAMPVTFFGQ